LYQQIVILSLFYINPAVFCISLRLPLSVAHWADH
jgi:hypothetical protein